MVNHDEMPMPADLTAALEALLENRPDDALQTLAGSENTADARMLRMAALINKGEFAQAAEVVLPEDDENADIQKLLSYCHAGLNDGEAMRLCLNRAWLKGMETQEVFDTYADILRRSGHPHEADWLSVKVPGVKPTMASRMLLLLRRGELREALALSEGYPVDAEDGLQVLLQRRFALLLLGEKEQADALMSLIPEEGGEDVRDMVRLMDSVTELVAGRPHAAAEELAILEEAYPFALLRIQALRDANRKEEALALAERIQIQELAPEERLLLCKLLMSMNEGEKAAAVLEYEADMPAGSDAHFRSRYFRAKALLGTEKKAHGVQQLEKLIQDCKATYIADTRRAHLCILQCMCHRDLGQMQKAVELRDFLKKLYPGDARVDALLQS